MRTALHVEKGPDEIEWKIPEFGTLSIRVTKFNLVPFGSAFQASEYFLPNEGNISSKTARYKEKNAKENTINPENVKSSWNKKGNASPFVAGQQFKLATRHPTIFFRQYKLVSLDISGGVKKNSSTKFKSISAPQN